MVDLPSGIQKGEPFLLNNDKLKKYIIFSCQTNIKILRNTDKIYIDVKLFLNIPYIIILYMTVIYIWQEVYILTVRNSNYFYLLWVQFEYDRFENARAYAIRKYTFHGWRIGFRKKQNLFQKNQKPMKKPWCESERKTYIKIHGCETQKNLQLQ